MSQELDAAAWSAWVPANHAGLRWEGRARFNDEGTAVYDWTQVRLHARFEGERLALYVKTADNYLDVVVDGKRRAVIGKKPNVDDAQWKEQGLEAKFGDGRIFVLEGFGAGEHNLLVAKRTGPNIGLVHFQGLRLAAGSRLLSPPPAKTRRIEFLGDSLTNGYGNEGPALQCKELPPYENSSLSWARQAATALGAEAQMLAYSGYGAVRNYGDKEPQSKDPFPTYYPHTVLSEKHDWDRSQFKAQVVVVLLGTNDYSTEPAPSDEAFVAGYRALLAQAREGRPGLPIVCACPLGRSAALTKNLKAIVDAEKADGHKVRLMQLPAVPENELGCDWHPLVVVHERWAKVAEEELRDLMNWPEN